MYSFLHYVFLTLKKNPVAKKIYWQLIYSKYFYLHFIGKQSSDTFVSKQAVKHISRQISM